MLSGATVRSLRRASQRCVHTLQRSDRVNVSCSRKSSYGRCFADVATPTSGSTSASTSTTSSSASINSKRTNIDHSEVDKFSRLAATWWDPDGEMGMLHRMNPVRLKYIRDCCISHFRSRLFETPPTNLDAVTKPLAGLRVVDIGCGGGLLTEPLARMGAEVVGIDAAQHSIMVARRHAEQDPTLANASLSYEHASVEDLRQAGRKFDVVCALEIVEHVPDSSEFLRGVASLVDDGGGLFVSTLNKTMKSYALAIAAAEYVLRWVPPGTHDWTRFLSPEAITRELTHSGLDYHSAVGMTYDPLHCSWNLNNRDLDVNYALFATRKTVSDSRADEKQ